MTKDPLHLEHLKPEDLLHRPRGLYINGNTKHPASPDDAAFYSIDPSTGSKLALIHPASESDIDDAVASAKNAFPGWSSTTPAARARILQKAASLMALHAENLAKLDSYDNGRALSETTTVDLPSSIEVLEYCANFVGSGGLDGRTVRLRNDGPSPSAWFYETKEPIGVCAAIGAWNYPLQIAVWKSAPCLAAGNTMVYKPSEFSPLHADALAAIYSAAGLPDGVFNVVQGDGRVGAALVAHPGIGKVSFTGQVSTGQKVAESAGKGMKYVTTELGGKSPLIILPDCPVSDAVDGAMMANFYSTGQVCTNGTRVFVPKSMLPEFETSVISQIEAGIRIGDVHDMSTNMGPLANEPQWHKVRKYIADTVAEGKGKLLYGGPDAHAKVVASLPPKCRDGFWVSPTVFTNCTDDMTIVKEEIFGPVMCILPYDDSAAGYIDTVIERANDTTLGLAAGVFTRDINLAHKVVARLDAGITWINTWGESPAEMCAGGWKMSGVGVENGRKGIEAWTQTKSTLVEMAGRVDSVFKPK